MGDIGAPKGFFVEPNHSKHGLLVDSRGFGGLVISRLPPFDFYFILPKDKTFDDYEATYDQHKSSEPFF